MGLVESHKGPDGSIFRSPAHWNHHRRCFIRFSRARQLGNTSNFDQKAVDPGSEFILRTPKIKKFKICQNNPNSIPNAFLWSLMKTNHILKQFANTSARSGPVFSDFAVQNFGYEPWKYTFCLKSPMLRRGPSREPWQPDFWWIHHRRCLVRIFRARQPDDIPKFGQNPHESGSEFSSGAPKIVNF